MADEIVFLFGFAYELGATMKVESWTILVLCPKLVHSISSSATSGARVSQLAAHDD